MDGAAGAAAAGLADNERRLLTVSQDLERLQAKWGHVCMVGHDADGYWSAPPRAGRGWLRAGTADELDRMCAAEFGGEPS
jgi:hypothetical protein